MGYRIERHPVQFHVVIPVVGEAEGMKVLYDRVAENYSEDKR